MENDKGFLRLSRRFFSNEMWRKPTSSVRKMQLTEREHDNGRILFFGEELWLDVRLNRE